LISVDFERTSSLFAAILLEAKKLFALPKENEETRLKCQRKALFLSQISD